MAVQPLDDDAVAARVHDLIARSVRSSCVRSHFPSTSDPNWTIVPARRLQRPVSHQSRMPSIRDCGKYTCPLRICSSDASSCARAVRSSVSYASNAPAVSSNHDDGEPAQVMSLRRSDVRCQVSGDCCGHLNLDLASFGSRSSTLDGLL
jgi:hypothetical protein